MENKAYTENQIKGVIEKASAFIDKNITGKTIHVNTEDAMMYGQNAVWRYLVESFYRLNIKLAISTCEDKYNQPMKSTFNGKVLDVDFMYGGGYYTSYNSVMTTAHSDIVVSRAPQVGIRQYIMLLLYTKKPFIVIPSREDCDEIFTSLCKVCSTIRVVDGVLTNT